MPPNRCRCLHVENHLPGIAPFLVEELIGEDTTSSTIDDREIGGCRVGGIAAEEVRKALWRDRLAI
jgi:hypothetical protein